jgi:hypothetical protein
VARSRTTWTKENLPPHAWRPGQSGNPKGRAPTSLLEPARALTGVAFDRLRYLVDYAKDERVQLDAAAEILNRGWGKPPQALAIAAQNETERVTSVVLSVVTAPPRIPLSNDAEIIDGAASDPNDSAPSTISINEIRPDGSDDV